MFSFRRDTFPRSATLPGVGAGPGAPSPVANLDAMMMNGTSRFHAGTYAIGNQANNYINHSQRVVPMDGDTQRDTKDNMDWAMPHFTLVQERTVARYTANDQTNLFDMPVEIMSWSQFNFYLKSEAGRKRYGHLKDCKEIRADWRLQGVVVTAPSDDYRLKTELKVTMTMGKRCRIPNVFVATGRQVRRGDYLYLVFTRHKLEGSESESEDDDDDQEQKNTKTPTHYWKVEPYVMPSRREVPAEAYMQTTFTGSPIFFGTVTDVWSGANDGLDSQKAIARRALFPDHEDPEEHRKELTKLTHVEVQIGVHC